MHIRKNFQDESSPDRHEYTNREIEAEYKKLHVKYYCDLFPDDFE